MAWPPHEILAPLCAELGLGPPADGPDAPVEQRLGQAHERGLGAERRGRGVYYTPAAVVEYLVEHTLGAWLAARGGDALARPRILDPACGAGAFLAAAYRRILRRDREAFGRRLDWAERVRVLQDQIHGIELDPRAARLCRLVLAIVALEEDAPARVTAAEVSALADLATGVRCGDALLGPAPEGGFDVVLGNPPYLGGVQGRTRLPAPVLAQLRRRFTSARGTIDASVMFQELALRLLAPGGRAGLLVPSKFLAAPFGAAFRALAAGQSELRLLADLSEAQLFPGTAVYPVVYVLEARPPRPSYPVEVQRFAPSRGALRLTSRREATHVSGAASWAPLLSESAALVHRLQARFPPLRAHYQTRAAATAEEAYRLRAAIREGRPDEPAFLFLTSGAIRRYGHRHGAPQRYLGARLLDPYLPRSSPLLTETRRRQYAGEKLVVASMTRRLRALWDRGDIAPSVPALQVTALADAPPLPGLLALLNSRLLSWLFRGLFSPLALSGGYLPVGQAQLGALPIAGGDDVARRRLSEAAERLMSLEGAEREAADRDLDRVVYQLYGLDEAEVAVVEAAELD